MITVFWFERDVADVWEDMLESDVWGGGRMAAKHVECRNHTIPVLEEPNDAWDAQCFGMDLSHTE